MEPPPYFTMTNSSRNPNFRLQDDSPMYFEEEVPELAYLPKGLIPQDGWDATRGLRPLPSSRPPRYVMTQEYYATLDAKTKDMVRFLQSLFGIRPPLGRWDQFERHSNFDVKALLGGYLMEKGRYPEGQTVDNWLELRFSHYRITAAANRIMTMYALLADSDPSPLRRLHALAERAFATAEEPYYAASVETIRARLEACRGAIITTEVSKEGIIELYHSGLPVWVKVPLDLVTKLGNLERPLSFGRNLGNGTTGRTRTDDELSVVESEWGDDSKSKRDAAKPRRQPRIRERSEETSSTGYRSESAGSARATTGPGGWARNGPEAHSMDLLAVPVSMPPEGRPWASSRQGRYLYTISYRDRTFNFVYDPRHQGAYSGRLLFANRAKEVVYIALVDPAGAVSVLAISDLFHSLDAPEARGPNPRKASELYTEGSAFPLGGAPRPSRATGRDLANVPALLDLRAVFELVQAFPKFPVDIPPPPARVPSIRYPEDRTERSLPRGAARLLSRMQDPVIPTRSDALSLLDRIGSIPPGDASSDGDDDIDYDSEDPKDRVFHSLAHRYFHRFPASLYLDLNDYVYHRGARDLSDDDRAQWTICLALSELRYSEWSQLTDGPFTLAGWYRHHGDLGRESMNPRLDARIRVWEDSLKDRRYHDALYQGQD